MKSEASFDLNKGITFAIFSSARNTIRFWRNSVGTFFFKFVSKVKHCIDHILGMVGLTDVKLKKKGSASIGCLVNYVLSTFDFTHDLDYFSRSNYKIALFQDLLA